MVPVHPQRGLEEAFPQKSHCLSLEVGLPSQEVDRHISSGHFPGEKTTVINLIHKLMCTLRSPQWLIKIINDYGDLKDGQSIVLIHRPMLLFYRWKGRSFSISTTWWCHYTTYKKKKLLKTTRQICCENIWIFWMDIMDQQHRISVLNFSSKSQLKQVFLSHNPTEAPVLLPEAVVTPTWCMWYPVRWIRVRSAASFCVPVSPSPHFWLVSIVSDYQQ